MEENKRPVGIACVTTNSLEEVTGRMTESEASNENPPVSISTEVLERFSDVVFALDEDWRFTYVNGPARTMLKSEQTDLTGTVIWEECPTMTDSVFHWEYERAMETQEPVTFESYYPPKDSWFEVHVHPSETGISVYARDVTDPGARQQELEEREQALRRAYEVLADSNRPLSQQIDSLLEVVRTAIGTDYATLSRVDTGADEYHFEHVAVPECVDLQAGDTTSLDTLPNCAKVVETEETLVLQDVEAEAPELVDPEWGISCYLGSPIVVNGDVYGTFCFYGKEARTEEFSDWEVTFIELLSNWLSNELTREVYAEELEESNERLEQFAYAASHDLQEPLRMVSSYLQLIERRYADELDEDGEEFIEFAVEGADRMRDMIEGLLNYSRIETRGNPFEPVNLEMVLSEVRRDLEVKIEKSNAEITADALPWVRGDIDQLRQVFQNLLDNAIEYSGDDSPRVHVSAERIGDAWEVSVADEGIGVAHDDSERIFEVFQSVTADSDHSGSGIGLALCERIVERHDGEIWVESEPVPGATFRFTLPVTDAPDY